MRLNKKRALSATMAVLMCAGSIGACTWNTISVYAAENEKGGKEEVVYVSTDAYGNVQAVNVVNIFGGGDITDYGTYTQVKLLNTTDDIDYTDDTVFFTSAADRVYYQGTMSKDTQLPWNINIEYTLDGRSVTAEELAGASGRLVIYFSVDKNENGNSDFYDSYALQASFTLDADKCENIVADGATMANVGSDKQISYTILPGKGLEAEISADVTDFEMDAAAINAVRLSLDIDIDDEELLDKVREIMDAADELDSGAEELSDGTEQLKDGGADLNSGAKNLRDGVSSLNDGVNTLKDGVDTMYQGLKTINANSSQLTGASATVLSALGTINEGLSGVSMNTEQLSLLVQSSGAIAQAIDNLYSGAAQLQANLGYAQYKAAVKQASGGQLDIDELLVSNGKVIDSLNVQYMAVMQAIEQIKAVPGYEYSDELKTKLSELEGQAAQLAQMIQLITADNAAITGVESYLGAFSDGVAALSGGLAQLKESYARFNAAINTLATQLGSLAVNMNELAAAINTLTSEYGRLDSGIRDYTDGVAQLAGGYLELIDGINALSDGSWKLLTGADDLLDGTVSLYDGIVQLSDGVTELKEGTAEFYDKTRDMDVQIEDEIDDTISSMSGSDIPVTSFVSAKNDNVDSVQFVIKTSAVEKPEVVSEPETVQEKLTFWQKLMNLFK